MLLGGFLRLESFEEEFIVDGLEKVIVVCRKVKFELFIFYWVDCRVVKIVD